MKNIFIVSVLFLFSGLASPVMAQQSCVTADCHAEFQEEKQYHPQEQKCTDCHLEVDEKHVEGDQKPVLKKNMCTPCHDAVLDFQFLHAPVSETTCQLCHNPHGDMKQLLLSDCNFVRLFVDYTDESYKLCFSCHKRDLLMFPDTSYSTGFRNGIKNLHFMHVNKEQRGRSCKLCHGVHGANQVKLMVDKAPFGNWPMPIGFKKTETGGSCAPGCHEKRSYDRKVGR